MNLLRALIYTFLLAVLLILALVPNLFPLPTFYSDKMIHISVCTIILIWVHLKFKNTKILLAACTLLLLAGVGLEIVQGMIPDREVSIDDIMANIVGIITGTITALLLRRGIEAGEKDLGLITDKRIKNRKIPG